MIVLVPSAKQVGATTVIVDTAGVTNITKFVKPTEATDVQLPFPAVTVYAVPTNIPLINPAAPAVGPTGVNVYVTVLS